MKNKIVWTALASSLLSALSVIYATFNFELAVAFGLAAINSAVLSLRE